MRSKRKLAVLYIENNVPNKLHRDVTTFHDCVINEFIKKELEILFVDKFLD